MSDFENENEKTNNENVTSHVPASEDVKYGGYICALVMGIIAAVLIGLNLSMINDSSKYYPKLFLFGIVFLGLTIGFLVCPGARVVKDLAGYDSKEKISTVFWKADTVEHIIRIVITLICTGFGIYIMVEEKFYLCGTLTLALITGGAAVLIIKTIVQWIIDASKTVEEKEEIAKDETKYSSVVYRICCIVIAALIGAVCGYQVYEDRYALASDFNVAGYENTERLHHSSVFDKYIKENLDKEVPYRLVEASDGKNINFVIDIDELTGKSSDYSDEDKVVNISVLKAPLSKLLSFVMVDPEQRTIAFVADNDYSEYDKHSFEKLSYIKEYFDKNPFDFDEVYDEYLENIYFLELYKNGEEAQVKDLISGQAESLVKSRDIFCIVGFTKINDEFIYMWDVPSFTEYYNSVYQTNYEPAEMIRLIDNQELGNLDVSCASFGTLLYYIYIKNEFDDGMIFNYGTSNVEAYSKRAMQKVINEMKQDKDFVEYINENFSEDDSESEE